MSPVRPCAVCDATEPICPACGSPLVGRMTPRPGGVLATCLTRRPASGLERSRGVCGAKVVILDNSGGLCTVVGLARGEFEALQVDPRPLRDALRALGVTVGRAA